MSDTIERLAPADVTSGCGIVGLHAIMRPMGLLHRLKRWWAPGEYDDERGESDGEGFARSDEEYSREQPTSELVHGRFQPPPEPRDR